MEKQEKDLFHLVSHLRRVKPRRPRMSSTRSIWIAGRQHFTCGTDDRESCPCWILRNGLFDSAGWQVHHSEDWSKSYKDQDDVLMALCASCHYRITRQHILEDEKEEEDLTDIGD